MLTGLSSPIALAVALLLAAAGCLTAVLGGRARRVERRRLQRQVFDINDQYRLLRQALRDTEDACGRLQRDLGRSEDTRRELELLCGELEEEIGRLREVRAARPTTERSSAAHVFVPGRPPAEAALE